MSSPQVKSPIARVTHLTARYGERVVLSDITLEVQPGEVLVILGGSGCGKTTLLKHFIGLLKPHAGTVELFGRDWWGMDEAERDEVTVRMGVLFQNGALLGSKTLAVNVGIPLEMHTNLPDEVIARVVRTKLRQVGLTSAEDRLPSELSGGMRKRAALARALALDPELLFCDEPSAGLDPQTALELDQLLLDLRETLGLTLVVVTHEVASIRRIADRIAFLEGGRLVFIGTVEAAEHSAVDSVNGFFRAGSARSIPKRGEMPGLG